MGFYAERVVPLLTDLVCRAGTVRRQRQKIVPLARGRVLEIGFGSGLNIPYYDPDRVEKLWALDPLPAMRRLAAGKAHSAAFAVELLVDSAEHIPMEDESFDTVLVTYALCTIPGVSQALEEMLVSGGRLNVALLGGGDPA